MSNAHFSRMPTISIPRTKMKLNPTHSTSFNHGELVPIGCFEVLPGDSFKCSLSALIRMTQPIVPFMDTLECEIHAFFVPLRLVYKHTEEFFGDNKDSAGYQQQEFQIPQASFGGVSMKTRCVSTYLGKPICKSSPGYTASILKERCYNLIWSDWYRAQQLQDPFVMLDSDDEDGYVGHYGLTTVDVNQDLKKVCKKFDYFTAATISPQYGEEVLLPLGSTAPIGFKMDPSDKGARFMETDGEEVFRVDDLSLANMSVSEDVGVGTGGYLFRTDSGDGINIDNSSVLYADLSKATAASVNQIRYAFQLQKYLERANFGTRYFEVLASHFGVTSPDARLQRPEYLGGRHFYINVQQVLSTAGAQNPHSAAGKSSLLGQPGANSTTASTGYLFSKGFVEHGYVMIMCSTRQATRKYSQGLLREDSRKDMFDFYFPEFANLGDQAILNKEISVGSTADEIASQDQVFGYQEHWAEYRYLRSSVSGMLNPNATSSEDYWTLSEKFASRPVLGDTFITENRDNLARVLVNGSDASIVNDYIADFYFDIVAVRPLPAYTIPGLIDHFGTR